MATRPLGVRVEQSVEETDRPEEDVQHLGQLVEDGQEVPEERQHKVLQVLPEQTQTVRREGPDPPSLLQSLPVPAPPLGPPGPPVPCLLGRCLCLSRLPKHGPSISVLLYIQGTPEILRIVNSSNNGPFFVF